MQRGFSLVELSIVLVILGLLTGGILGGQSLIRASEMRSVTTEYNNYVTATQTFRDKYFAIPGDMTNATAFWGTATCPGNNTNTTAPGIPTCNGNGDGIIGIGGVTTNETYRFWQHLANAGLIEGSFTGVTNFNSTPATYDSVTTPNVPRSKIANAWWNVTYLGQVQINDPDYFDGSYGNAFRVGGSNGAFNLAVGRTFRPEEGWNIDTKIDDGKPALGKVRTVKWQAEAVTNAVSCSTPPRSSTVSIAASSEYHLAAQGINCSLVMDTGF